MIAFKKEDLNDQPGMERAFRGYFVDVKSQCDGTFNALLGAKLVDCDYKEKTFTMGVPIQNWMLNPNDMLHGGITASLMDVAMGLVCRYGSGGGMTPTVSMGVEYLRAIPPTGILIVRAKLTHRGINVCHASAEAWMEGKEDRLVATSNGAYYVAGRFE